MIEFRQVTAGYGGNAKAVITDMSFRVPVHGFLYLRGASGAGKTTILRLITKELEPEAGEIRMNGRSIQSLKRKEVPAYRRRIGLVSQDMGLLKDKSVYENIELAKRVAGAGGGDVRIQVAMALRLVGMEEYYQCYPEELSGGQQRRICIARAMVNHPDLLLADEPTGDLDPDSSLEIMGLLNELNQRGTTMIVATHDGESIRHYAHTELRLEKDGEMYEDTSKSRD
ncbi:MAG: ATP-binding cassette domain-containing protein [Clostridium sp.]|nr:ATP-binding cassette domain-containing protein [Clostridium sp.]